MVCFQTMTPETYKSMHTSFKIVYAFHSTPFGNSLLAVTNTDKAIVHFAFVNKNNEMALTELKNNWPLSIIVEDTTKMLNGMTDKIFSKRIFTDDSILILAKGTEFQIKVWEALRSIPLGTTTTYSEIATKICKAGAGRAVGNAVMKNNIAYLVPCHRVKGKSGSNKYKWGIERKENILMYEHNFVDN